jgi:hypothetical protein
MFLNKFSKLGIIKNNGEIKIENYLLSVVLHEKRAEKLCLYSTVFLHEDEWTGSWPALRGKERKTRSIYRNYWNYRKRYIHHLRFGVAPAIQEW